MGDWWSFGVLLYEMITGRTPFVSPRGRPQTMRNILHAEPVFPAGFPVEAEDLIRRLLVRDPEQRFGCTHDRDNNGSGDGDDGGSSTAHEQSLAEFKAHPFWHHLDWELLEQKRLPAPYKPNPNTQYVSSAIKRTPLPETEKDELTGTSDHFAGWQYRESAQSTATVGKELLKSLTDSQEVGQELGQP